MGQSPPTGGVAALEGRAEGWIAGLQLSTLWMAGRSDTAASIQVCNGSHFDTLECLVEKALQPQTEQTQAFLPQTSILERLNADLCEAVTV